MKKDEYFHKVTSIIDGLFDLTKLELTEMSEQEKQIVGAFCFGIINGYSLEMKVDAIQIQSAVINMLVNKLNYEPEAAMQFCDFLIRSTDKEYHPTINAIIRRGMEGYYQLDNPEELKKNLFGVVETIKKYN